MKSNVTALRFTMDPKQDVKTKIVAKKKLEVPMDSSALMNQIHMAAHLRAPTTTTFVQPWQIWTLDVKSKLDASLAKRIIMENVVRQFPIAMYFANQVNRNVRK